MSLSTSNSNITAREIPKHNWKKLLILNGIIICCFVLSWEAYLRSQGHQVSISDSSDFWAEQREKVNKNPDATILVGSSRLLHAINLYEWEKLSGALPIQLSTSGTTPVSYIKDIANNSEFRGTMIIDMPMSLFFTDIEPIKNKASNILSFYKSNTPARKASHAIMKFLEGIFVFIEPNRFDLSYVINKFHLPNRTGVFSAKPAPIFTFYDKNRQAYMTKELEEDITFQRSTIRYYENFVSTILNPQFRNYENYKKHFKEIMNELSASINKINIRGGKVIIINLPSSGKFLEIEKKYFPRDQYWDQIIDQLNESQSIHFDDFASLRSFDLPDDSHLNNKDAIKFTQNLLKIIKN